MAASTSSTFNGGIVSILRPRPVKSMNPNVLRAQTEEDSLKVETATNHHASVVSSGRSTPLPDDAPPSAQATSSAKKQIRAQQKHRMFPSIEYEARVSHFDPRSEYRDFRGFFVLFWIGLAIMVITTMLRNIKDTGYPLRHQMWDLMTIKTWQLGLSDAAMVSSTSLIVPFQQAVQKNNGWLSWKAAGMPLHIVFQGLWLISWVNWPFILDWTWTAQVFFTLHTLVILMKMHSYAFYNGHLSNTQRRLAALDEPETASTAAADHYPSSLADIAELDAMADTKKPTNNAKDLSTLRTDLAMELVSPLGSVTYPSNLTMVNYADYLLCPTLCYELEYPRTLKTQWMELFYKTLAVFGCIFLLTLTSEEFIVPVLHNSAIRLQAIDSWFEMGLILAESISELLFPFMVTLLLVFLVIFEYVLGAFAEIACFADRHFYSDWWNSCDWLEFSRKWNLPVHHFLRRHVYAASRPYMSRSLATLITFLVSAFGHELVMGCITKKLRGYGFVAQMSQLPIVAIQRTRVVRSRKLLNNVLFWISMIIGLAMLSAFSNVTLTQAATISYLTEFNVASSLLSGSYYKVAITKLEALFSSLPPTLRSHLASAVSVIHRNLPHQNQRPPPTLSEKLLDLYSDNTTATSLIAAVASLLILVFSLMSWWPSSGRYSPFTSFYNRSGPPHVTEDDYAYLPNDDHHPAQNTRHDSYGFPSSASNNSTHHYDHQRHGSRGSPRMDETAELGPDIIILKHKGTTYPLHFPAFSIAEGDLKVRDLRRQAAQQLKVEDPRRVKLLYKSKQMRDDKQTCKHENLKQNSEVMCVVSSEAPSHGANSSDSEGSDSVAANGVDAGRMDDDDDVKVERKKRKGHRGPKKRRDRESGGRESLAPPTEPAPSTSRTASPAPPAQQTKKPSTPAEMLNSIGENFDVNLHPLVKEFIARPPAEQKTRDLEYKRLGESILAQVLLKLDGVETMGDEVLRGRRKDMVKRVQGVLNELDAVGKR